MIEIRTFFSQPRGLKAMLKSSRLAILLWVTSLFFSTQLALSDPFPTATVFAAETQSSHPTSVETQAPPTDHTDRFNVEASLTEESAEKGSVAPSVRSQPVTPIQPAKTAQPNDPYNYDQMKQFSDQLYGEGG